MPLNGTPSIRPLVARILSEGGVEAAYAGLLLSLLESSTQEGDVQRSITLLPALVCAAHGGGPDPAAPACAAWFLIRFAAKLFDDVEDGDAGAELPLHVNVATGLLELAHLCVDALAREGLPRTRVARIDGELSRAVLRAAGGQHRDLTAARDAGNLDPDAWLAVASAKSGALFGWAAWAGAAIAGARGARRDAYRRYGQSLGLLLQVADDYNDVWAPEAPDGPIPEAPNLAIAYARLVADEPTRIRLDGDLRASRQGEAQASARVRQALTDLGAQAFVLAAARAQQRLATEALAAAGAEPAAERPLVALLAGVMPALRALSDP